MSKSKPSKSHNATEAPVGPGTTNAAEQASKKLTLDELDFVTFVSQYYHLHGELLSAAKAFDEYAIKGEDYSKWFSRDHVRAAIKGFDVPLDNLERNLSSPDSWKSAALTPAQLVTINSLLNLNDQRSDAAKLKSLNVKPSQYQAWLRDPVVQDYVNKRIESLVGTDGVNRAMLALVDKADQGDTKAISLLLEYTGKFVPVANRPQEQTTVATFQNIISRILEIIVDECDGETAFAIGERIKLIMASQNMAAGLLAEQDNEITVPEVMPARQLSPEMAALAARAGGNT